MAKTPDPEAIDYKLVDFLHASTVSVALPDGRHFAATVAPDAEVHRNRKVLLSFEKLDEEGVPVDAIVTGHAT